MNDLTISVRAAFNFTVDPAPLTGPGGVRTPYYGLFRSDTGEAVGRAVTSRYIPHTTDDVLALVESAAAAFGEGCEAKCSFMGRHYVSISPTKEQRISVFGTSDNIFPRVILNAGYDGSAFKASTGYYRDLCRNMHIMRLVSGTSVAIRHTGNLRAEMDDLLQTFSVLRESWGTLASVIHRMQAARVDLAAFLSTVYGEPGEGQAAVTRHRKRTETIVSRLFSEAHRTGRSTVGGEGMVSAWEAFNAVQGYAQHSSRRRGSPDEMARMILAGRDGAVRRAEQAAMLAI